MATDANSGPLRFWQFRIRDLLFVITISAFALGWWCDRRRLFDELKLTRAQVEEERSKTIVNGIVRATKRNIKLNLVELNIGKDDWPLLPGMEFDVYQPRGNSFDQRPIGRIILTRVEPDVSVVQIVEEEPWYRFRRGDSVTMRFSLRAR